MILYFKKIFDYLYFINIDKNHTNPFLYLQQEDDIVKKYKILEYYLNNNNNLVMLNYIKQQMEIYKISAITFLNKEIYYFLFVKQHNLKDILDLLITALNKDICEEDYNAYTLLEFTRFAFMEIKNTSDENLIEKYFQYIVCMSLIKEIDAMDIYLLIEDFYSITELKKILLKNNFIQFYIINIFKNLFYKNEDFKFFYSSLMFEDISKRYVENMYCDEYEINYCFFNMLLGIYGNNKLLFKHFFIKNFCIEKIQKMLDFTDLSEYEGYMNLFCIYLGIPDITITSSLHLAIKYNDLKSINNILDYNLDKINYKNFNINITNPHTMDYILMVDEKNIIKPTRTIPSTRFKEARKKKEKINNYYKKKINDMAIKNESSIYEENINKIIFSYIDTNEDVYYNRDLLL